MDQDRSPWGPAVIALVFFVLAASALIRFADMPGVWIIVVLCLVVIVWQTRTAVLRYYESDDTRDHDD